MSYFSLYLPKDEYIYDEISYSEYSLLKRMNLKPPDIVRKLTNTVKNKRLPAENIDLITEEQALGLYI